MTEEIKQGFIRQRRNLIMICLILLFVEVAKVSFNQINLLGNKIVINDPKVVTYSLWVAFLYWLVRYFQYFNDYTEKKIALAVRGKMNEFVILQAFKIYKKHGFKKANPGLIDKEPQLYIYNSEIYGVDKKQWEIKLTIDAHFINNNGQKTDTKIYCDKELIKGKNILIPALKAWCSVIFTTRLFTEYIFPFVLAFITILSKVWLMI